MSQALAAIVAPSRALVKAGDMSTFDEETYARGKEFLTRMGWALTEAPNCRKIIQRFAGSDEERAVSFQRALLDPDVDVAVTLRGGYGAHRILPLVDWDALKGTPVSFVGLSDTTALNMALYAKSGVPSWQGPTISFFAHQNSHMAKAFMNAMTQREFSLSFDTKDLSLDVTGTIWGGNLSMITSLIGTPYFPQITDGIFYIEDVAEPAWRIERMLLQLKEAGILAQQKALIVGSTKGAEKGAGNGVGAFTLGDALEHIQTVTEIPVFTGLSFGHIDDTVTLPFAAKGRFSVTRGKATLWSNATAIPTTTPLTGDNPPPTWWI